jgi:hypothetical protein
MGCFVFLQAVPVDTAGLHCSLSLLAAHASACSPFNNNVQVCVACSPFNANLN